MKQIVSVFIIAASVAACNSNSTSQAKPVTATDTAGLATYNAWKAEEAKKTLEKEEAKKSTATASSHKRVKTTTHTNTPVKNETIAYESANTAKAKKKGLSKAVKGGAIGAASGALLGVELDRKNRARGAVIGGVVGAATGVGIGHHEDKKDQRN